METLLFDEILAGNLNLNYHLPLVRDASAVLAGELRRVVRAQHLVLERSKFRLESSDQIAEIKDQTRVGL